MLTNILINEQLMKLFFKPEERVRALPAKISDLHPHIAVPESFKLRFCRFATVLLLLVELSSIRPKKRADFEAKTSPEC